MKIQSNGVSLNVRVKGDGELTLVFLHYWGGSSRTWHHVTGILAGRFQTVAVDQRGWGESAAGSGDFSVETLADDVQGIIDTLALKRYLIVGHSMGGKIAQLLASRRPVGLAGVVLVAPGSPGPSIFPLEQRKMMAHAYDTRESITATVAQVLAGKTLSDADLAQVVEDSLRGAPEAKVAWPMATMMEDIRSSVAHISVPVLVVAGEWDKVDPVELLSSHVLPHLPGANQTVLPRTGHLSPLESPVELSALIDRFAHHCGG
ncbi:alpha/beta hydrolase [Luteibacter sp. PPL201]|uniref:Alpha/beta hydrolase n=1 Tax=Luteibacter sahnii TaxID=3021977 RepID=A0ABT6BCZ1_9GAMM